MSKGGGRTRGLRSPDATSTADKMLDEKAFLGGGEEKEQEEPVSSPSDGTWESLSRRRKIFLAFAIAGTYAVSGSLNSIYPPIYPSEAEGKGATPSQYGFVFGIANLAALLTSPFWATHTGSIGARSVLLGGIFSRYLSGGVLFGMLNFVEPTMCFLGLSYVLRFVFGIGDAAYYCSLLATVIDLFPNKAATMLAASETFFGLGYTIGPAIGSWLYVHGGFQLPYYVVGGLGILFGICLMFALPSSNRKACQKYKKVREEKGGSVLTLGKVLSSPSIWFPYLDNIVLQSGFGLIGSMLEPHAKEAAGLSQVQVGMVFLTVGAAYMFQAPLIGQLCDKLRHPSTMTGISVLGNLIMCAAMVLIGPASFLQGMEPSRDLIYIAALFTGSAYAVNIVSTFARSHSAAKLLGYNRDINTYVMLTGMWTFSFYLGNFVGPTAAGFLVEQHGFRFATAAYAGLNVLMVAADVTDIAYKVSQGKRLE